jgi:hypothetical protein
MNILIGMFFGAAITVVVFIYIGWKETRNEEEARRAKTLQELSDDELKSVACAFIHDLTEEIEKREKNKRGEIQNANKPFEEFNGKE